MPQNKGFMVRMPVRLIAKAERIKEREHLPSIPAALKMVLDEYNEHPEQPQQIDELIEQNKALIEGIKRLPTFGMFGGPSLEDLG